MTQAESTSLPISASKAGRPLQGVVDTSDNREAHSAAMQLNPQAGAWGNVRRIVQDMAVGFDDGVAAAESGGRAERTQAALGVLNRAPVAVEPAGQVLPSATLQAVNFSQKCGDVGC